MKVGNFCLVSVPPPTPSPMIMAPAPAQAPAQSQAPAQASTPLRPVVGTTERVEGGTTELVEGVVIEEDEYPARLSLPPHSHPPPPEPLSISDFWLGEVIGEGSYGRVCHARLKGRRGRGVAETCHSDDGGDRDGGGSASDHRDFAIKMMEKREIARHKGRLRCVMAERDALTSFAIEAEAEAAESSGCGASPTNSKSQFVIRLRACFHSEDHLFFVTDLCWETLEDVVAKIHHERAGKHIIDDDEAGHRGNSGRLRSDTHPVDVDVTSTCTDGDAPVHHDGISTTDTASSLGRVARYYVGQILLALEFIHSRGIVHRDVKPSNVLIAPHAGTAKLADFGSSRSFRDATTSEDESEEEGDGGIAGTAGYAPPELLSGDDDRTRSTTVDLWSLGCVAYHVLVGRGSPFESGSECLTVRRIMSYARGGGGEGEGEEEEEVIHFRPLMELESGDDDLASSSDLIHRLIHPDPASRLGAGDVVPRHVGGRLGNGRRRRLGYHPPAADDATCYHSIRSHPFFAGRGGTVTGRSGGADDPSDAPHVGAGSGGGGDWWTMLEGGEVRPPYRPNVPRWLRPHRRDGCSGDGDGSNPRVRDCMRDGATEFGRWLMENG